MRDTVRQLNNETWIRRKQSDVPDQGDDWVLTGLTFVPDWESGTMRVRPGFAAIADSGLLYWVDTYEKHVSIPDEAAEVYYDVDTSASPMSGEVVVTTGSAPAQPSLQIGTVDGSQETFDDTLNRKPTVDYGTVLADKMGSASNPNSVNGVESPADGSELESLVQNASDGLTVELVGKRYEISQGLVIEADDVTIRGPRSAVVAFPSGGSSDSMITIGGASSARRCRLSGFTLDCANQTDPGDNFVEDTPDGHGVHIDDSAGNGVQGSRVERLRVEDAVNEGIAASGRVVGAQQLRSFVTFNEVLNAGTRGIHPHNDHSLAAIGNWVIGGGTKSGGQDVALRHSQILIGNTVINWEGRYCLYGSDYQNLMALNTVYDDVGNLDNAAVRTWTGGSGFDYVFGNSIYGTVPDGFQIRNLSHVSNNWVEDCTDDAYVLSSQCVMTDNWAVTPGNRGIYVQSGGAADGATISGGAVIDPADENLNGRGIQNDGSAVTVRDVLIKVINNTDADSAIQEFNDPDTRYENLKIEGTYEDSELVIGSNALLRDNEGIDDFVSHIPFSTPSAGDWYLDDGTNTGSGTRGKRVYDGAAWQDAWTL